MSVPDGGDRRGAAQFGAARDDSAGLEGFAHLRDKVCALWGNPEMEDFVAELMLDSRDGKRKGLPATVMSDLVFLAEVNRVLRVEVFARQMGIDAVKAARMIDKADRERHGADLLDDPQVSRDMVMSSRDRREATEGRHAARPLPRRARRSEDDSAGVLWVLKLVLVVSVLALAGRFVWSHAIPRWLPQYAPMLGHPAESQSSPDGDRDRAEPATTSTR